MDGSIEIIRRLGRKIQPGQFFATVEASTSLYDGPEGGVKRTDFELDLRLVDPPGSGGRAVSFSVGLR
jgi:hypothetical protein